MRSYHRHSHRRRRRGFSLIEILVVIGILVGLMAILTPMIMKARKQAARTRQASDFQTIAAALEAYKADHGDYPRAFGTGTGFAALGQLLIGPGPKVHHAGKSTPPEAFNPAKHYDGGEVVAQGAATYVSIHHNETGVAPAVPSDLWIPAPWADGADGPGFRVRLTRNPAGEVTDAQGQSYGPYLQPDRFRVRGYALLDVWDNPILYFPARPGAINVNAPSTPPPTNQYPTFVGDTRDITLKGMGLVPRPLFDAADNIGMLHGLASQPPSNAANIEAREKLEVMLGDANKNGWIDGDERAHTTGPFILWSAGPDAEGNHEFEYGLDDKGVTDDVVNFDLPIGMLKK